MGKYKQDARLLLEYVGGKENIAAVSHCVSRMRFVLNDPAKADVAKIEALKSAKGTFTQAGQFQVIIGNTVSDFYNDFIAVSGIDGVSKDAVKSAAKQNQNALQKVMSVLAEIFAPLIPAIVYAGISGSFRVVFGAIFGFVYAPLVITGLHHMSNAIDMQLIADFGGTMLWPMIALSNIAQGSAVLGMIYLQRKNAAAQEVNVPSCISCYLGVTEPAMFGVNLKFHFPFICGMIGSAIAAVVCVATSTTANAIGVGGIPGILSIQPAYMLSFALCMAIAIVVPFVLTVIVGRKKGVA
ncbi:MAG: glucose PTS transporter subunit EIIB [Faecalibacterium prausnitzii]